MSSNRSLNWFLLVKKTEIVNDKAERLLAVSTVQDVIIGGCNSVFENLRASVRLGVLDMIEDNEWNT